MNEMTHIKQELEDKETIETSLTLREYQDMAVSTAIYGAGSNIIYPGLGLGNEAGEVQGKIKKVLRDNDGIFDEKSVKGIAAEMGDVLWYLAALARDLGISLEDVAKANLAKLKDRNERGVVHGSGDTR